MKKMYRDENDVEVQFDVTFILLYVLNFLKRHEFIFEVMRIKFVKERNQEKYRKNAIQI